MEFQPIFFEHFGFHLSEAILAVLIRMLIVISGHDGYPKGKLLWQITHHYSRNLFIELGMVIIMDADSSMFSQLS